VIENEKNDGSLGSSSGESVTTPSITPPAFIPAPKPLPSPDVPTPAEDPKPAPEPVPAPEPKPEPVPAPEPKPEPVPTPDPKPEPAPETQSSNPRYDFDGDGKADIVIFRNSDAKISVTLSSTGDELISPTGNKNWIPTIADYDGDGKADFSWWIPSQKTWRIYESSSNYQETTSRIVIGGALDTPLPGHDFDGDGKDDPAIFRNGNGKIRVRYSSDGSVKTSAQGHKTWTATPADYDGDGKADFSWFIPSTGVWRIYESSNNYEELKPRLRLGNTTSTALAGHDFDGDGKADIAILNNNNGRIVIRKSLSGETELSPEKFVNSFASLEDYDGDGRTDFSWYVPGTKTLKVFESSADHAERLPEIIIGTSVGSANDMPVDTLTNSNQTRYTLVKVFTGHTRYYKMIGMLGTKQGLFVTVSNVFGEGSDRSRIYLDGKVIYEGREETIGQPFEWNDQVFFPVEHGSNVLIAKNGIVRFGAKRAGGWSTAGVVYKNRPIVSYNNDFTNIPDWHFNDKPGLYDALTGRKILTLNSKTMPRSFAYYQNKLWASGNFGENVLMNTSGYKKSSPALHIAEYNGKLYGGGGMNWGTDLKPDGRIYRYTGSSFKSIANTGSSSIQHIAKLDRRLWLAAHDTDRLYVIGPDHVVRKISEIAGEVPSDRQKDFGSSVAFHNGFIYWGRSNKKQAFVYKLIPR
jgi:hypothetical protein